MTVAELIAELQKMPQNAKVMREEVDMISVGDIEIVDVDLLADGKVHLS